MDIRTHMSRELKRPVLKPTLARIHNQLSRAKKPKYRLGRPASSLYGEITFDKDKAAYLEKVNFQGYFINVAKPPEKALVMLRMRIDNSAVFDLCSRELIIVEGETITSGTIKEAYANNFAEVVDNAWWFADGEYKPPDLAKIQNVVDQDLIDQEQYEETFFDCDDFTFALHGAFHHDKDCAKMPIFITWVQWEEDGSYYGHSIESFYDGAKPVIIEPQTDEFFEVPEGWKLWLLCG